MQIKDKSVKREEINKFRQSLGSVRKYKVLCDNYQESIIFKKENYDDFVMEYMEGSHENIEKVKTTRNISAPQENEIIKKEMAIERLENEIKILEEKRNFFFDKLYILNAGLEYLENIDEEAEYIIETKYLNKKTWEELEIGFNNKFRSCNNKYIGEKHLRTKCSAALEDFKDFIDSFPKNKIDRSKYLKKVMFSLKK